jgi:hypothetical protein
VVPCPARGAGRGIEAATKPIQLVHTLQELVVATFQTKAELLRERLQTGDAWEPSQKWVDTRNGPGPHKVDAGEAWPNGSGIPRAEGPSWMVSQTARTTRRRPRSKPPFWPDSIDLWRTTTPSAPSWSACAGVTQEAAHVHERQQLRARTVCRRVEKRHRLGITRVDLHRLERDRLADELDCGL